jgi:hypothetical protein
MGFRGRLVSVYPSEALIIVFSWLQILKNNATKNIPLGFIYSLIFIYLAILKGSEILSPITELISFSGIERIS